MVINIQDDILRISSLGLLGKILQDKTTKKNIMYKNSDDPRIVISNWMSSYSTIDYLAMWEGLYNPDFNRMEFQTVRSEPGRLVMTPTEWIEKMNAIGIVSKAGRYGGTYAHSDIAFEFASWVSLEFKLYLIKDYQRLKKDEAQRLSVGWDAKRELSKINYRIHTDAVKRFLIRPDLTPEEISYKYASEADVLNMALFGKTASQWRRETDTKGMSPNIRDYASAEELVVLINLEDTNADLISQGLSQTERLKLLREKAYRQLELLRNNGKVIEDLKQSLLETAKDTEGGKANEV